MDPMTLALTGTGAALLVTVLVVAVVFAARRERERQDRMRRWAAAHNWAYTQTPQVTWGTRLPGRNKRGVSLALSGILDGRPVSVGEYSYSVTTTHSTGEAVHTSTETHRLIVVVVRLPQAYPDVSVEPRGVMSKLGRRLFAGGPDTGGADFDSRFKVTTAGPAPVGHLVGPALRAAHLGGSVPAWSIHGDELLAYRTGRLDDPAQIPALAAPLLHVAALLGR